MTHRSRFLHRLKQLPTGARETLAATRLDLLHQGPWPAWLDHDLVQEAAEGMAEARGEADVRRRAWARLVAAGHGPWAETTLASIGKGLSWRLTPKSPDGMAFLHALAGLLIQAGPARVVDGQWDALDLPFLPSPNATLLDLWACPVHQGGDLDTLGNLVLRLEQGGMAHAAISETKVHLRNAPFPADGPLATDLWTIALLDAANGSSTGWAAGRWLDGVRTTPLAGLLTTYGRGGAASDMVDAMRTMDRLLNEVLSIGGTLRVQIFGAGERWSSYHIAADGAFEGDDPGHPWIAHTFKGALLEAMVEGGALIVDKIGALVVDGQSVRETCTAQLAEGILTWLDAPTCRQMFLTDHATGAALAPEPGRVYRAGPGI
jgi:hypothetical protein